MVEQIRQEQVFWDAMLKLEKNVLHFKNIAVSHPKKMHRNISSVDHRFIRSSIRFLSDKSDNVFDFVTSKQIKNAMGAYEQR